MAKDTFFFRHDYEPTTDPKIQAMLSEHGATGYGLFWRITEMLHSEALHKIPKKKYFYMAIAKQLDADVQHVEAFVKSCINIYELFEEDENYFWSNRVIRNIEYKDSMSQKRSDAGKKSAELKLQRSTSVQQVLTSVQQNSTYNIKEDNIILDNTNKKNNNSIVKKQVLDLSKPFEVRKEEFRKKVAAFKGGKYPDEMLHAFYYYWTACNEGDNIMQFEKVLRQKNKTFEIKGRLVGWNSTGYNNYKKTNNNYSEKVTVKTNML